MRTGRVLLLAGGALALSPLTALAAEEGPTARVAAFTAPSAVEFGERVELSGRVAPRGTAQVRLERREAKGSWEPWATVRANAKGRFSAAVPLRRSASIRARVMGLGDDGSSAGPREFVRVDRAVGLTWDVDPTEAIAGRPVAVEARVKPARPGERIVVEARRGSGAWRPLSRPKVRPGGSAAANVRLPAGGTWTLRARAAGRSGVDAQGTATAAPLRVHGANPHGVPKASARYIVQKIGEMKLYYYEGGSLRRVLPVVYGKPSTPTPLGRYRVYSKTPGPGPAFGPLAMWYHRGYGIHGTNQEELLSQSWRYYSLGCTRNYNDNIRWLYPRVPVGTPVLNIR